MADKDKIIGSSTELWQELSKVANFQDSVYDKELKESIAKFLNIDADNIEDELKIQSISPGRLLTAFLDALKPFVLMLRDLLNTYESAGARSNNNDIRIIDNSDITPLSYNLMFFKNEISITLERIRRKSEILKPLLFLDVFEGYYFEETDISGTSIELWKNWEETTKWIEDYDRDILPNHLPAFFTELEHLKNKSPNASYAEIKGKFEQIRDIVEDALQTYRIEYDESKGLKESISKAIQKYNTDFWKAEKEHWLERFVKAFYSIVFYHKYLPETDSITKINRLIEDLLQNSAIITFIGVREKYDAIIEILNMPFWKHRYELYSAWVFTCIVDSVSDLGIKYEVVDDVLQFKFSGSRLATIDIYDVRYEIWAEKRYKANILEGKGRKKHIQPDYSIIQREKEKSNTCILIECKQYKRPNNTNFADAVNDYARACSEANVFLVNYGRISEKLLEKIDRGFWDRYRSYGKMKPSTKENDKERDKFIRDIRECIEKNWSKIQIRNNKELTIWKVKSNHLKIELFWERSPSDLDLEVVINTPYDKHNHRIYQMNKGGIDTYPFIQVGDDCRKGPGTETIILSKYISGRYDIYVNNFTREDMIEGQILIKITSGEQHVIISKSGYWKENKLWYVGVVNAIGFVKIDEWL